MDIASIIHELTAMAKEIGAIPTITLAAVIGMLLLGLVIGMRYITAVKGIAAINEKLLNVQLAHLQSSQSLMTSLGNRMDSNGVKMTTMNEELKKQTISLQKQEKMMEQAGCKANEMPGCKAELLTSRLDTLISTIAASKIETAAKAASEKVEAAAAHAVEVIKDATKPEPR